MVKTKIEIEEINKTLHRFRGNCVHDNEVIDDLGFTDHPNNYWHGIKMKCKLCDSEKYFPVRGSIQPQFVPNYYCDLNLIREIEIRLSGFKFQKYEAKLLELQGLSSYFLVTAPASIRSQALVEVIESTGGG